MALFYVDRLSSRGDGFNEIGLAAKERWCLEHIDNLRHWRSLFRAVNIRKNRNPNLLPNICQNRILLPSQSHESWKWNFG